MTTTPDAAAPVAYLTARLDEDEAVAVAFPGWASAMGDDPGFWAHVERWEPAAVLADIAAKRAVLDLHRQIECVNCTDAHRGTGTSCRTCHHDDEDIPARYDGTCRTVLALAQAYDARPDFPDEWKIDV